MKLNKLLIFTFILLFSFSASIKAQSKLLYKANVLYDTMAFAEAIPKYLKVLKKDSTNIEAMIKLADCYRLTNDIRKSVTAYKKIIDKQIGQPIDKLFYAQALMATSNYTEAKKYMAEYNADSRGITFSNAIKGLSVFFKDSACYTIENLPFNSNLNDFSPRILGKKIIFNSSRKRSYMVNYINSWTDNNFFKLYYTQKKANGKYTHIRSFLHSLDNRYNAGPVCFSHQSNMVYLSRNNIVDSKLIRAKDGQVKLQLYAAAMNKKGTAYQYLMNFQYNNDQYNFMHPAISDDGLRLYFVSDMPGGNGGTDLWMCKKENDKWSQPKNLGKDVNTAGDEAFPYVKGNMLYFSSNGLEGIGGLDLFKVNLDEKGFPNETPENIGIPLNSPGDDFGIVFNDEGNKGYFSSNRKSLNFNDDIYGFTYTLPEKGIIKIAGIVTENMKDTLLAETKVELFDNNNSLIGEDTTNERGAYTFIVEPNNLYTITVVKHDYLDLTEQVNTTTDKKNEVFNVDLKLDKDPGAICKILVLDSRTNNPLDDAKVEILDNINGKKFDLLTTSSSEYQKLLTDKKLHDSLNYSINISKDGYYKSNTIFTYKINSRDTIIIKQSIDKILDIEPIYFDYDKFDIRADAAKKLNQLVDLLIENPKWNVELLSHTDCRGSTTYNNVLSEKRAHSTAQYLIDKGISSKRITGKGYGTTRMVVKCDCNDSKVSNCTEAQHQLNRRTEFKIIRK